MKPPVSDELRTIISALYPKGGMPLLVGGAVRDWLLGLEPKDTDIEVYRMLPEDLVTTLSKFGKVDEVGKSFGVIKLRTKLGTEFDFSLPRRESKTGQGHRGFLVSPDPSMTPKEACGRRDFTINAMAYDFLTDEVMDFYGGQTDLKNRVLRHTTAAFSEDPLRVLRGFQFASRFEMTVAPETAELCASIKDTHATLAKERIWGEWEKWATKGKNLLTGLKFLVQTKWVENYPELARMAAIDGTGIFAWHCLSDAAGKDLVTIFTMLCRGVGPDQSKELIENLGAPPLLAAKCERIRQAYYDSNETDPALVRRLSVKIEPASIRELCEVSKLTFECWENLEKISKELGVYEKKPEQIIKGRHLAGLMQPGPAMGKTLKAVYEAQLDGVVTDETSGMNYVKGLLAQ